MLIIALIMRIVIICHYFIILSGRLLTKRSSLTGAIFLEYSPYGRRDRKANI